MGKTNKTQMMIDVKQEFASENYEKIIDCADKTQWELIHNWQFEDRDKLRHLILTSQDTLDFWFDSITENKLWVALVRCGAWLGALETIGKDMYEKSMDMWMQKRVEKEISSIKHLPEILHLLEVRGIMTHGELAEKLNLNYPSTLTEIMKKIADLELVRIKKSGKYNLYSLTDAGMRVARQIRSGEDEQTILRSIIQKYELNMDETELAAHLRSLADEGDGVLIKTGQNIEMITGRDRKKRNIKAVRKNMSPSYNEKKPCFPSKDRKGKVCFEEGKGA